MTAFKRVSEWVKDKQGRLHVDIIVGWTDLRGKCSECGSPSVVIRINSRRVYKDVRIVSGDRMDDYCAEHVPAWVEQDRASMMQEAMNPPGTT